MDEPDVRASRVILIGSRHAVPEIKKVLAHLPALVMSVDAGAYVGDSIERFLWSVNGVFKQIYAFEPGLVQYQAMRERVDRLITEWALTPEKISL